MTTKAPYEIIANGEATAILPTGGKHKPITIIGTEAIRATSTTSACSRPSTRGRRLGLPTWSSIPTRIAGTGRRSAV